LYRIKFILAVAVLVFPLTLSAQTRANELGVFASMSRFDETTESDVDGDVTLGFDENIGYGVSYNRYWSNQLSTEFAAQRLGGDIQVSAFDGPGSVTINAGELNMTVLSATLQWHFASNSRIDPYIGAGAAYITGDADVLTDIDPAAATENVDLDTETTWLANAGLNFRFSDALSIGADAKYMKYEPRAEGDGPQDRIDVNPLVISAGLKFRF
jgi:outer membrane protein W